MAEFPNQPGYDEKITRKMLSHDEEILRKMLSHDERLWREAGRH